MNRDRALKVVPGFAGLIFWLPVYPLVVFVRTYTKFVSYITDCAGVLLILSAPFNAELYN